MVNVITRAIPDAPEFRARLLGGAYAAPPYPVWRWRTSPALLGGFDLSYSRRAGPVRLLVAGGALGSGGYRENNDDQRAHEQIKLSLATGPALQAELYGAAAHEDHGQVLFWCVQGACADSGLSYQPFRVDSTTLGSRTRSDEYLVLATARRVVGPDLALRGRVSWFRTSFRDLFRTGSDGATADRFGGEAGAEWHPAPGRTIHAGAEIAYATVASDLFGDHSQTTLAWYAETRSGLGRAGALAWPR